MDEICLLVKRPQGAGAFPPSFNDGLEAGLIYESQLSHSSLAVGVVVHRDHSLRRDHMLREM
jgi:hypothetical protein